MPTTRKANLDNKHTVIRIYGRFYGFALDNRWIGHVTRTKHRDKRLEYRASESKNIKWVERKGLAWKDGRRTPEELVVAHITTKRPIREEANRYNKQRMQLTTTTKESAWSWEACMHDMAIMMQCNLFILSGIGIPTHTYMVQVVLLHCNLNVY
jgi:hypothetical protein